MNTLSSMEIKDLSESSPKFSITGLIIAKGDYHAFESRFEGKESASLWFTIRDSKRFFINCKLYGSCDYVKNCDCAYKIGDVLTISQPKITKKGQDEYVPQTTSPFQLQISENRSKMYRESIENYPLLKDIRNQTFKSTSNCLKLRDLLVFEKNEKKCVDILIAVQKLVPVREVKTKFGVKKVCQVMVLDQTIDGMKLTIWNSAIIEQSEKWLPFQTILHLVDFECSFSNFDNKMILQSTRRSIVIENPSESLQAQSLFAHLIGLPNSTQTTLAAAPTQPNDIDIEKITDSMNIRMIKEMFGTKKECNAIVYAVITRFDINVHSNYRKGYSRYCKHCNQRLEYNINHCSKENCIILSIDGESFVDKFDLRINLSDHTGTLESCHMFDKFAEQFLNYTLEIFKELTEDAIDEIHQKYILERFAVKVVVKPGKTGEMYSKIVEIKEIVNFEFAAENIMY